jgi:hypothetical protein
VTELYDGSVYMSIRPYVGLNNPGKKRFSAVSTDGGATFGSVKAEPQLVDAGGVCGSVVRCGKGATFLFLRRRFFPEKREIVKTGSGRKEEEDCHYRFNLNVWCRCHWHAVILRPTPFSTATQMRVAGAT